MTAAVRTRCLLFFAPYLLFSILTLAYDYYDPGDSDTCPFSVLASSLSSAVGQASVVPPVDDHPLCFIPVESGEPLWSAVFIPRVSYRGPPLPRRHFPQA
jgi:hypothetical protein